jgi:hypothetical protein
MSLGIVGGLLRKPAGGGDIPSFYTVNALNNAALAGLPVGYYQVRGALTYWNGAVFAPYLPLGSPPLFNATLELVGVLGVETYPTQITAAADANFTVTADLHTDMDVGTSTWTVL